MQCHRAPPQRWIPPSCLPAAPRPPTASPTHAPLAPQHFTAPVPATPSDLRAAFSFVYEPQLSAERAAAAAAQGAAAQPSAAAKAAVAAVGKGGESANPAKVLDGLLLSLLGGVTGGGAKAAPAAPKARQGFTYPAEDIAALNAAKRFLVSAGVVNK